MVTLAKHIETLLLDNDCVVVPNFGGFIAHYQSAYYDEKRSTFFPPQRVIGFNPKLIMNDGLLVQSYMQHLDTDFSDANLHIEKEVDELNEKLYSDGEVTLANIGTISCKVDGTLAFVPSEKRIETPTLYGLTDFQCTKVSSQKRVTTTNGATIGNRFIGSALGVAVALILFFFLSVPVQNSYVESESYAYLGDAGLFNSIKSKSFVGNVFNSSSSESSPTNTETANNSVASVSQDIVLDIVTPEEASIDESEKIDTSTPEIEENNIVEEVEPVQINENRFHVIILSTTSEKEANDVVNQLHKKGYEDACIVPGKGIYKYRVSISNLNDEASAYNQINQFRANKTFLDAWVLSSK